MNDKFQPGKHEFIEVPHDECFVKIKNDKVIVKLIHMNYVQGLKTEWIIDKVIHCTDGSTNEDRVFSGKIPTNAFAKQLFKNILF